MDKIDTFTEQDVRLFESIKDQLSCGCGNTFWGTINDQNTRTFKIKCLHCKKYLSLRQLYSVDFPTKITVNTDPQIDLDLTDDLAKTPGYKFTSLEHIRAKVIQIQNLCLDIQTYLHTESNK